MKFHTFPAFATSWPNVMPGDIVISPESRFYNYDEYATRDDKTRLVITQKNPMLVIARFDKWEDRMPWPDYYSMFVVFSISRGFLVIVMPREPQEQDGKLGT